MEKVLVEFFGCRKFLRAEPFFCKYCGSYHPHVFVKPRYFPNSRQSLFPDGKAVRICVSCLEHNRENRYEPIYQLVFLVQIQALEMATASVS